MSIKVTVVDYGVGNLLSIRGAIEYCAGEVVFSSVPTEIEKADRLFLPGVGAFENSMTDMRQRELIEPVLQFVETGRPLIGVCLGMQLLMEKSEEFGSHHGLGLVPGKVVSIPKTGLNGKPHRIPSVGWNKIYPSDNSDWSDSILQGLTPATSVYFGHSFMAVPKNQSNIRANYDYGGVSVCAVIQSENIYGCQFHPEKSGPAGLHILRKFLAL